MSIMNDDPLPPRQERHRNELRTAKGIDLPQGNRHDLSTLPTEHQYTRPTRVNKKDDSFFGRLGRLFR